MDEFVAAEALDYKEMSFAELTDHKVEKKRPTCEFCARQCEVLAAAGSNTVFDCEILIIREFGGKDASERVVAVTEWKKQRGSLGINAIIRNFVFTHT